MIRWVIRGSLVFVCYSLVTAAITWPLVIDAGTGVIGDDLDPLQTLWGFWWIRHWPEFGDSAFYTFLLWWPLGAPLWMQTWDLPSALLVWPLWGVVREEWIYNCPVLLSFPAAGLSAYACARSLWGGSVAPFLAGGIYTFSTFHYAAAEANLHIASMHWPPLFVLALREIARRDGWVWPSIGGVGLGLATLTSPYYALFCLILTGYLYLQPEWRPRRWMQAGVGVAATFLVVAGWALVGMLLAYWMESYTGAHEAVAFSADAQSPFVFNAMNRWAQADGQWGAWTGSRWSTGSYVGWGFITLAVIAAFRVREARVFVAIAMLGYVLSLGPHFQFGGTVYSGYVLPFGWLVQLVPWLAFGGIVSRFAWLTVFGVAMAAGATLALMTRRDRTGLLAAILVVGGGLIETLPARFTITRLDRPAVFSAWLNDPAPWAVLDATGGGRALWHQTLHRRPLIGGYLTRTPVSRVEQLGLDSVLAAMFLPPAVTRIAQDPRAPVGRMRKRILNTIRRIPPLSAEAAQRALRNAGVRYVIVNSADVELSVRWRLEEASRTDSIVVYAVPPDRGR